MNWKLKKIKVSDLKEFKGNPRNLTEKGMADLKKSITKFGIAEPIVCNTDLEIIGGHARKKTLEDLQIKEVDCYIPDKKLSKQEVKELNIRLNKNIAGDWDFDILANEFEMDMLKDVGFEDWELKGVEYDYSELEKELKEGEGLEDCNIIIVVPLKFKNDVVKYLSNGEQKTGTGLGKGVLRRCGLL